MEDKEKSKSHAFSHLLLPGEEVLWVGRSRPMILIKPLMGFLKVCAIWGLLMLTIGLCLQVSYPEFTFSVASGNRSYFMDIFSDFVWISLPVIAIAYALYWRLKRYEPIEYYAVTNQRVLSYNKHKSALWPLNEIKRIDIVGDVEPSSVTFTRFNNDICTWRDITDVESLLQFIRDHRETPVLVNRLPE